MQPGNPPLRPAHIVAGCISLGLVAATGFHRAQQPDPLPRDPETTPWIGLPPGGMDASMPEIRALLLQEQPPPLDAAGLNAPTLVSQCGNMYREPTFKERYIAHIGEGAWGPAWQVSMDVNRDSIDIRWSEGGLVPPPPPPRISDTRRHDLTLVVPSSTVRKSRAEVESIRGLWKNPALWNAQQDARNFGCNDGNVVLLEACIDGRYGARIRNSCDVQAGQAMENLWRAFNELLPPPPKREWRDAKGNLVDAAATRY